MLSLTEVNTQTAPSFSGEYQEYDKTVIRANILFKYDPACCRR